MNFLQTNSFIRVVLILCGLSIFDVEASLSDLSLLSGNYEIDDYLAAHQPEYPETPWIVTSSPSSDYEEHNLFLPATSAEFPSLDTSSNHLGSINYVNSQFGNAFIPSTVDKALNSLLNSDTILTQSRPIGRVANDEKSTDRMHNVDVFSTHKPFTDFNSPAITSGNPLNNLFFSSHFTFIRDILFNCFSSTSDQSGFISLAVCTIYAAQHLSRAYFSRSKIIKH